MQGNSPICIGGGMDRRAKNPLSLAISMASGGECRSRTCPTRWSRRVSTAVPYRSANSPYVAKLELSAGLEPAQSRSRNPALFQLSYESILELRAGLEPA